MTHSETIGREQAIERASDLLRTAFGPELHDPDAGDIVIDEPVVAEHDNAWAVPFNSRRFVEDGDPNYLMLPSMIVVPKDGAPAHYAPTAMPLADYLAAVGSGDRQWSTPPSWTSDFRT